MAAKKVLIVDDNSYIRTILAVHLKSGGFETDEADDGTVGLAKISEGGIDLVLLDVMMPGMSGLEVLDSLKSMPAASEVPVVMISAYGQRENIINAARCGAKDFIAKPFTRKLVLEKVNKHIKED